MPRTAIIAAVFAGLAVSSPPAALAQTETWLGEAPFCRAAASDCDSEGMSFVRSHASGDGETCLTGEKILCRRDDASEGPLPTAGLPACPSNAKKVQDSLRCACSASQFSSGTVWGTEIYTDDSSICRAALHAGDIPPGGGGVEIEIAPGRRSYQGTNANGVTTQSYGPWKRSFRIVN